jgi:hypothetical protein
MGLQVDLFKCRECFCKMTKATRRIVGSPWPREFLSCQQSVVVFKEPRSKVCFGFWNETAYMLRACTTVRQLLSVNY